jgi:hypothetical protein
MAASIKLPEQGSDRLQAMAEIYVLLYDMSSAELEAVARCVEAVRSGRAEPVAPGRMRRR